MTLDLSKIDWNSEYNRPTLGKIITDIRSMQPEKRSVVEIAEEQTQNYIPELVAITEQGKKETNTNFYILINLRISPLTPEMYEFKREIKLTCPTPNYDQTLFFYNREADRIEYVWSIPDRYTCHYMLYYKDQIPVNEHELLNYVIKFANGDLFEMMKIRNGEKKDSPLLDK